MCSCLSVFFPPHVLQGTASVVLAGLVAALKLLGGTLADQAFLFLGAGEVRICSLLSMVTSSMLRHSMRKINCIYLFRPRPFCPSNGSAQECISYLRPRLLWLLPLRWTVIFLFYFLVFTYPGSQIFKILKTGSVLGFEIFKTGSNWTEYIYFFIHSIKSFFLQQPQSTPFLTRPNRNP